MTVAILAAIFLVQFGSLVIFFVKRQVEQLEMKVEWEQRDCRGVCIRLNGIWYKNLIAPEQRKSASLHAIQLQKCDFQQR